MHKELGENRFFPCGVVVHKAWLWRSDEIRHFPSGTVVDEERNYNQPFRALFL